MQQLLSKSIFKLSTNFGRRKQKWQNYKLFNETQYLPEDELVKFQIDRLNKLLKQSYENVPYYKKNLNVQQIKTLEDFRKIPFLTKEIIKAEKESLLNKNLPSSRVRENSTSGSSGNKTIFYSDIDAEIIKTGLVWRGLNWLGIDFGDKELRIWGSMRDVKKSRTLINKIKFYFGNYKVLSSYKLNDNIVKDFIKYINTYKPDQIHAYPSSLYEISNFILKNESRVYKPKAILTSGEQLYEWQREVIRKAFNTDVFSFYGCREVGFIAQECKNHEGLHITAENIIAEVVNEKGENIYDEEGEIVVTDLSNYVFPFIRYKILDRGIITREKCTCGRTLPLLKAVHGRSFDLIKLKNGGSIGATFFTHLFREKDGIDDFRIYQNDINKLLVEYVTTDLNLDLSFFKEKILEHCENQLDVEFKKVDRFNIPDSGKKQFIFSKL